MASAAEIANALDRIAAAAHRQRAGAAATRPDVNATDLLALAVVRRTPSISPGALARALHMTPGGTNGVIRRLLAAELLIRKTSPKNHRDVALTTTPRGERLMTTGVAGWDPQLLERLAAREGQEATDMMNFFATVAEATEQHADALAATAEDVNSPAADVPLPIRWG